MLLRFFFPFRPLDLTPFFFLLLLLLHSLAITLTHICVTPSTHIRCFVPIPPPTPPSPPPLLSNTPLPFPPILLILSPFFPPPPPPPPFPPPPPPPPPTVPPRHMVVYTELGEEAKGIIGPYIEGDNLTIHCRVRGGYPSPRVTWWDGEVLLDAEMEEEEPEVVTNTLTLLQLTRADLHKQLTCHANNNNLTESLTTTLAVDMHCELMSICVYLDSMFFKAVSPPCFCVFLFPHVVFNYFQLYLVLASFFPPPRRQIGGWTC